RLWSNDDKLCVTAAGNLGIATTTPTERLEVRGNIKLGSGGDHFGLGCLDNLRMVAGRVSDTGVRLSGSGFSVVRLSEGHYRVSYATPFLATPVVVATLVDPLVGDNFVSVLVSNIFGFDVLSKD